MSRFAALARTASIATLLAFATTGVVTAQRIESPESVYYRFTANLVAGHGWAAADLMTFEARKAFRTEIMALTPVRSAKADEIWVELLGANREALDQMGDREIVARFLSNLQLVKTDAEATALADKVSIGAAQYIEGVAHLYITQTVVIPALTKRETDEKITLAGIERLVRTDDGWRLVLPTWTTRGLAVLKTWVSAYVAE